MIINVKKEEYLSRADIIQIRKSEISSQEKFLL